MQELKQGHIYLLTLTQKSLWHLFALVHFSVTEACAIAAKLTHNWRVAAVSNVVMNELLFAHLGLLHLLSAVSFPLGAEIKIFSTRVVTNLVVIDLGTAIFAFCRNLSEFCPLLSRSQADFQSLRVATRIETFVVALSLVDFSAVVAHEHFAGKTSKRVRRYRRTNHANHFRIYSVD